MSTVLIVDDESGIRHVLRVALGAAGHDVVAAEDAEDALRHAAAQPIDLALVDVHLGRECGIALLDELRRRHPGLQGIATTGAEPDPCWSVPVLLKPFSLSELVSVVDAAVPTAR